jgi:type IV pilus assembly protein PilQ
MKMNWPAYRLACLILVSSTILASPLGAQLSPPAPGVRMDVGAVSTSPAASAATSIAQVEIGRSGERTSVRVEGNGRLIYKTEQLGSPDRLVLDFSGIHLPRPFAVFAGDGKPLRRVRLSQFQSDVARVVIDLERNVPYHLRTEGTSVTIELEAAHTLAPVRQAASRTRKEPAKNETAKPGTPSHVSAVIPLMSRVLSLPLPESLTMPMAVLARPQAPTGAQAPVPATPTPAPASSAQAAPAHPQAPSKYTGEPISVNLKDVDLKDFFRLIHEISGLNVVLDPTVKGTLTIVLDEVPWDQALDIVLKNNNLDKQLEGNVLRVATKDTLKKEAESRRDLARAEAEAVDPVTTTRVLSYAKAATLRDTLKRFLSSRGEILADERSNTLIIRDIPSSLPTLDNLIRQLDRKAQQVEIEARVVAASRSFARDIGTQFAFASSSTSGRSVFGGSTEVGTSPVIRGSRLPTPPLVSAVSSTGGVQLPLSTNLPAGAPTSGFTFAHASPNFALDFIITAAESKGIGKLLSKPRVITQNNEKAIVKQGTKIPIQTSINNTISVQFIDAVLKLEVTPQITAEGTVFMDITVENTQIDAGIPRVQGIPALDTQAVESKLLVSDGGTVVIGGIIISSQRTDVTQVPLVGSIPLIGNLFKRTSVNVTSQEMLFFLTPRITPS